MRRIFSFIIGSIVGAIIGAGTALLLAPTSGEELRGQINSRAMDITSDIKQSVNTKRIELRERLDTLRTPKARE
jgi:gas vesicle protein